KMRLQALHNYTDQLPLTATDGEFSLYGMDTEQALRNGALHGIVAEVEYYRAKYMEMFSPLKIILAGGNSVLVSHFLKDSYVIKPDLVLEGLNEILKTNA
ncbi:MAG TPA: hypothetical protein PKZ91_05815, partial [Saprospiraceae bacterium]|nr:hypothetical protein [Saprospiraceae bacterium]